MKATMEKLSSSEFPGLVVESVFFQGIDGALSAPNLLRRIAKATTLKRQYLETLRTSIEEREKSDKYRPLAASRRVMQPYKFQQDLDSRQWIADLFDDNEDLDSEHSDNEITEEMYREMLRNHRRKRGCSEIFSSDSYYSKYMHLSTDYINRQDKWPSHSKAFKRMKKRTLKLSKTDTGYENPCNRALDITGLPYNHSAVNEFEDSASSTLTSVSSQMKKKKSINMDLIRKKHWKLIAKKEVPKAFRNRLQNRTSQLVMLRRLSRDIMKRQRANAAVSLKVSKEQSGRLSLIHI